MPLGCRRSWIDVRLSDLIAAATAAAATTTTATTAAVATAATTAAATTAAVATASATTTAAAAAIFARASFVHGERATVVLGAVDSTNRRLGFCVAAHLDETEALAPASVAVVDDFGTLNRPELSKHLVKVRARDVEAQIATIKFLPHRKISCAWKKYQPATLLSGLKRKRPEWRPTRRDG
jgi:hypothetical protein